MAIKWSKFWLDRTSNEMHVHTTKCNEEKNRCRREQEDFDLTTNLKDNEDATTNFIAAAGGEQMVAQVCALCLPLLVCCFTFAVVCRLYGLLRTPAARVIVSRECIPRLVGSVEFRKQTIFQGQGTRLSAPHLRLTLGVRYSGGSRGGGSFARQRHDTECRGGRRDG